MVARLPLTRPKSLTSRGRPGRSGLRLDTVQPGLRLDIRQPAEPGLHLAVTPRAIRASYSRDGPKTMRASPANRPQSIR
jgi:hypothetical protein